MKMRSLLKNNPPSIEGIIIFSVVAYETAALSINFLCGKKVLMPITDIIGPMTHSKTGKIVSWLFLGYWWDHFYMNGERIAIERAIKEHDG